MAKKVTWPKPRPKPKAIGAHGHKDTTWFHGDKKWQGARVRTQKTASSRRIKTWF